MNDVLELTNRATWNDVMTYGSDSDAVALLVPAARTLAEAGFTLADNCPADMRSPEPTAGVQLRVTDRVTTVRMSWSATDDAPSHLVDAAAALQLAGFTLEHAGDDTYTITGRGA